jgi:HK97 family phage portal protein
MSLLRRARAETNEQRMYGGGAFTAGALADPFGPPFWTIPTNGQTAITDGGGYVAASHALKYWPVFACVRIIADFLCGLPVDAYTGSVGMKLGESTRIDPKPALLTKPSAYASWVQWVYQVLVGLLTNGNAYGIISSTDRLGYATQIDLVDPATVRVKKADERKRSTGGDLINVGEKFLQVGASTYSVREMWHLPGPQLPGELAGLSPIAYSSRLISLGNSAEQFGAEFFANGIHPTAVATTDTPINSDQASEIKSRIKAATANRDIPVLGSGVNLKPWTVTPTDSMLIEVQKLNAVAIAQIYGIPADMIGVSERGSVVTYVNREQRAQELLDDTLAPWILRLEDGLSALFPRTTFVKFDTNILLRNDMKTRFEAYQIALGGSTGTGKPFMEVDEVRQFEDWPPMPEQEPEAEPAATPPPAGASPLTVVANA